MTSDKAYAVEQRLNTLISGIDAWHNLGSMSAGWTNGGARYRGLGMGLVIVEIVGLIPSATIANGTIIWTTVNGLPAAYSPSINRRLPCGAAGAVSTGVPELEFDTNGQVKIFNIPATITGMDGTFILSTL
jgi:hypothetical protein